MSPSRDPFAAGRAILTRAEALLSEIRRVRASFDNLADAVLPERAVFLAILTTLIAVHEDIVADLRVLLVLRGTNSEAEAWMRRRLDELGR